MSKYVFIISIHYYILILTEHLTKYDWGSKKNLEVYGSPTPPKYLLSKMTAPTAVYYSKIDKLIPEAVSRSSLFTQI